ncbi:MAG: glycosyltransferase family 2 protein [Antricoccus sp.]
MSSEAPEITAVVVTYSPGEHLDAFITTLRDATTRQTPIILVDNGSQDGSPEAAVAAAEINGTKLTLIRSGSNLGFGRAANLGIAAATTEWVLVANPDIRWRSGALDELSAAIARWPKAAALGPAILTDDGGLYPSARALPTLGNGIGHAALGWIWPRNRWTRAYRRDDEEPIERTTGWLSGACLLLRRSAIGGSDGFDPAYFMYFEDVDLCKRLADRGWQIVYVPSAMVEHAQGHAASREPRRMMAEHHRSAYRFLAGQYPGARWFAVRLAMRAGLRARAVLSVALGRVSEGAAIQQSVTDLATESTEWSSKESRNE